MKKKLLGSILLGACLALGFTMPAMADSRKVVTLGADLSQDQMDTMMRYFGVTYDGVEIIYINNTDERNHLGSYVPLEQIGTHTYSCALVNPTSSGGIQVKTANLEWVTCNMIASTLSTSGVTNCQVVAACPFKVSGTGALTGVIMAYENASREVLDPVKVELANQELVTTGNLANEVGQSKATAVINETKVQVIENNVTNVEDITNILNDVSNEYNVTINPDQSEQIAELMKEIAEQEYDIVQLKATLDRVQANVAGDAGASEEAQKAAEEQAQASEEAALEAARQAQEEEIMANGGLTDDGVVIDAGTAELPQEENILENTDPTILESAGAPVEEADTTQTVQEQSEQQTENNEWAAWEVSGETFGGDTESTDAPVDGVVVDGVVVDGQGELPADGTVVDGQGELPVDGTVVDGQDEPPVDGTIVDGALVDGQETIPEEPVTEAELQGPTPDNLNEEDRKVYDAVKEDLETMFDGGIVVSEDGSRTVYLEGDAGQQFQDKIEKYLLRVLTTGVEAIAAEEAANPQISQEIVKETSTLAPERIYDDEKLEQLDKYVRRLIFKDSENFLAESYLEDADKTLLYDMIMDILEEAIDPQEDAADGAEAVPAAEEVPAGEEAPVDGEIYTEAPMDGEYVDEGMADEFDGFDESFEVF